MARITNSRQRGKKRIENPLLKEGVPKDLFNRRAHKEGAKHANINNCISDLCGLSEKTLRSLRLIYFDFLDTLSRVQVMLDSHLADLYSVETKAINRAVKRNIERFPDSFHFQLTEYEWEYLRSQFVTLNSSNSLRFQNGTSSLKHGGRRYLPYVFTEQGVAMLSAVLRSETAVRVSIRIINAFVEMRKVLMNNGALVQRLDKIELKQLESDHKFERIFKALESKSPQPEKGVFFDGQVFDAYVFVSGLIKRARTSIVLIDTYVDETVLALLDKRKEQVTAVIYTPEISRKLQPDLEKHNAQYPAIQIKPLALSHDRFLIIDEKELYVIGASLKDLGKKWFAFSRLDDFTGEILKRIEEYKQPDL